MNIIVQGKFPILKKLEVVGEKAFKRFGIIHFYEGRTLPNNVGILSFKVEITKKFSPTQVKK